MAALPEEDAPTVTGTPGERRVDGPLPPLARDVDADGDDTTTAEAGPPAPRAGAPEEEDDDEEDEDRTVLQAAAAPPSPAAAPPRPAPAAAVRPAPATVPRSPAVDVTDDAEPIEDSITATAPRVEGLRFLDHPLSSARARGLPITIPGSVEIRTVEHDELLDETEVRTRPGHSPLEIPATLRSGRPEHASSQPPPPPRPAAGRPPSMAAAAVLPAPYDEDDDDEDDDGGVTTQAPVPRVGTLPGLGAQGPRSVAPDTSPRASPPTTQPALVDAADEPPTRPGVGEADEPPTRPGVEGVEGVAEAPTVPALDDVDRPTSHTSPTGRAVTEVETARRIDLRSFANEDDGDESVTARGPAVEPYDGDSVTTQAPAVPSELIEAASKGARPGSLMDDTTAGTTHKVTKIRASLASSPADGESESITTQAPGPLTNILRVLASESSPDTGSAAMAMLEDDEPPENRTAVMANAPLQRIADTVDAASRLPPIRPTGGPLAYASQAAAATNLAPTSDSGLRVAGTGSGSEDRASLGALLAVGDAHGSGVSRIIDADAPHGAQPSVHDVDLGKGPRYGLLVAVVAVISIMVPVTLFVVLRLGTETAAVTPGAPSELTSEVEKHDPPRAKGVRGKNGIMVAASAAASAAAAPSASASAAPSASASGKPPVPPRGGFPFRR